MLVDELAAPPARGHRNPVPVDGDNRDECASAGADQVRDHAALGAQRHAVTRVLHVATADDTAIGTQARRAHREVRVRTIRVCHRVDGDAQQGVPIDRRHLFHAPHFT